MIDLILTGTSFELVVIGNNPDTDLFDLEEVHVLAEDVDDCTYGYGVNQEKGCFVKEPCLLVDTVLVIPAEIWISRKNFSDSGIVWFHKDFNIMNYLLQEYELKEAELIYHRIKDFNKYEEYSDTK